MAAHPIAAMKASVPVLGMVIIRRSLVALIPNGWFE